MAENDDGQTQDVMAWPGVYGLSSSDFVRNSNSQEPKPTIVLVHDAFHLAAHLQRLADELESAGYPVLTPQLPSSMGIYQPAVFEADVQALYATAKPEVDYGRNIVFVLHGYSGLPGPIAAGRLNHYALNRPGTGFVMTLVFVAALVANEGECVLDIHRPDWLLYENGILGVAQPEQVFFQDCSYEDRDEAVSLIRPQLADSFRTRVTEGGWYGIPCLYALCESDMAVSWSCQNACVRKLRTRNAQTAAVSLRSGHSPYLSVTSEMVRLIMRVSGNS